MARICAGLRAHAPRAQGPRGGGLVTHHLGATWPTCSSSSSGGGGGGGGGGDTSARDGLTQEWPR